MSRIINSILIAIPLLFSAIGSANALEKIKFDLGGKTVTLELADTESTRTKGLMFRETMGENEGMLFVFENESPRGFWMKNTLIPLSIGFFDGRGHLLEHFEMIPPKSLMDSEIPRYQSKVASQLALEMNANWFVKNKITPGASLRPLEKSNSKLLSRVFRSTH